MDVWVPPLLFSQRGSVAGSSVETIGCHWSLAESDAKKSMN